MNGSGCPDAENKVSAEHIYDLEEGVRIRKKGAFYNPVQKFNRTLTIRAINAYITEKKKESVAILECMSASGLRGIRYHREVLGRKHIVLNDLSAAACREIIENCKLNGITTFTDETHNTEENPSTIEVHNEDCRIYMLKHKKKFDVIDIDPFGTCAPYMESAFEALKDGGLLCVTSTDTKVLCDVPPESCYKYYGSASKNCSYSHELAVRVVLSFLSRTAGRIGCSIEPLLSLSVDFFVRVFVIVRREKKSASLATAKDSLFSLCACNRIKKQPILESGNCPLRHAKLEEGIETCSICGRRARLFGPFWAAPLHNPDFISVVIRSLDGEKIKEKTGGHKEKAFEESQIERRIHGMLNMAFEELDLFGYYHLPTLSSNLLLPVPPLVSLLSFLHHNGYTASFTHCKDNAIKTDAPLEVVYIGILEYFRAYKQDLYETAEKKAGPKGLHASLDMYKKGETVNIDYTATPTAKSQTERKYLKFQDKSGLGWGPKKR